LGGPLIPNHHSATLSDVDRQMIHAIPVGGNWKDIPQTIPSERLVQIRASFARGEGSRSTYYGRLRPDAPSYTINTYFTRPGNGCHIHYAQDRVLSHREAARLQSFPDSFVFAGSRSDVAKQIGNAVPPLMAFQVALQFGEPGVFVDLFAGAGGLSLGFKWAGWTPLVANDLVTRFLDTYTANVHGAVVPGDIRGPEVSEELISTASAMRRQHGSRPFLVLGGPPCQGFSTAGNRRSMNDERNHLFADYRRLVECLAPDGFVFENVMGLRTIDGGRAFSHICSILSEGTSDLAAWMVRSERHGVPQRRSRILLVGSRTGRVPDPPAVITAFPVSEAESLGVDVAVSVSSAIGDLPPLAAGQDGSELDYASPPTCAYQELMRGLRTPADFVSGYRLSSESATDTLGSVQLRLVA
jgi:DNA (cytosine-5)-methyltransferase 1